MRKQRTAIVKVQLLSAMLTFSGCVLAPSSSARPWTITDRENTLKQKIYSSYKANQLTLKERDSLLEQRDKIVAREKAMKDKNGGRLSYADASKLEKELNSLSERLQKKVLEKRLH
jgi:hypothetical protein